MYNGKVIDSHLDIAWNYQSLNRDFLSSAYDKAVLDSEDVKRGEGIASIGVPELRRGNFGIVCGSIWVEPAQSAQPSMGKKYANTEECHAMAIGQLGYYRELERESDVRIVRGLSDIRECLDSKSWALGVMLSIEGADFIRHDDDLDYWCENGVRLIAPVWQRNQFGGCAALGGGLSPKGKTLLHQMSSRGLVLDISHMSQECANQAVASYDGVIVSSHTTCQSLCPGPRQISDFQIAKVHESGGVVGLMLWNKLIDSRKPTVGLEDLFMHLRHIYDITGSWDSVGIGSSLDGGFGTESLPSEMRDVGDCSIIGDYLLEAGLPLPDVEKVMFRNWERTFIRSFA